MMMMMMISIFKSYPSPSKKERKKLIPFARSMEQLRFRVVQSFHHSIIPSFHLLKLDFPDDFLFLFSFFFNVAEIHIARVLHSSDSSLVTLRLRYHFAPLATALARSARASRRLNFASSMTPFSEKINNIILVF